MTTQWYFIIYQHYCCATSNVHSSIVVLCH